MFLVIVGTIERLTAVAGCTSCRLWLLDGAEQSRMDINNLTSHRSNPRLNIAFSNDWNGTLGVGIFAKISLAIGLLLHREPC